MTVVKDVIGVLLVEDNPGDVELARISLEESRIDTQVTVADSLESAITYIESQMPDVILLDLGLPDVSGLDGVELMLRHAPTVPIIVLSGLSHQDTALRALESGAQDFLVKGEYTPELLARAVGYAIERKRAQRELLEAARYDAVTGLINRAYFLDLLGHALDRARRKASTVNILFLDLDHFKSINDNLGHAAGDALLKQVAGRIARSVRNSDVVARLGGDEFTIMVEDAESATAAARVADKVLAAMQPAFELAGNAVIVTPSIGIAGYPDAGDDVQTLLQNADIAMYRAKSKSRNTVEFFNDGINTAVRESFEMEMDLARALREEEFERHYQPIVDRFTGGVSGVEALLRWRRDSSEALLQPDVFLPMLEKTGLIREVGYWVLQAACTQCRIWQRSLHPSLRISVNISPRQLSAPGFVEDVDTILRKTGLEPASLEIEVNEQTLLEDSKSNLATLKKLRAMGIAIAVDNFGSGYSSLSSLTTFPFDTVKIDRKLIEQVAVHNNAAMITTGILSIANGLGRQVIAGGIEVESQLDALADQDCHKIQGFLFSQPLTGENFEVFFEKSTRVAIANVGN